MKSSTYKGRKNHLFCAGGQVGYPWSQGRKRDPKTTGLKTLRVPFAFNICSLFFIEVHFCLKSPLAMPQTAHLASSRLRISMAFRFPDASRKSFTRSSMVVEAQNTPSMSQTPFLALKIPIISIPISDVFYTAWEFIRVLIGPSPFPDILSVRFPF